jgi:hypothetical protein
LLDNWRMCFHSAELITASKVRQFSKLNVPRWQGAVENASCA